jgi:hypothetical protein
VNFGGKDSGAAADRCVADVHPARRSDDTVDPLGDAGEGEQPRLDRPAAPGLPARMLGVVVRESRDELEAGRCLGLEPLGELVDRVDERVTQLGKDHSVGEGVEIGDRVVA